jgi:hypothetical protein
MKGRVIRAGQGQGQTSGGGLFTRVRVVGEGEG